MKVDTAVFLIFACLAVICNLLYGRPLLETIMSGTNTVVSIISVDLFILWLFPILGLFFLLVVEKFRTRTD